MAMVAARRRRHNPNGVYVMPVFGVNGAHILVIALWQNHHGWAA